MPRADERGSLQFVSSREEFDGVEHLLNVDSRIRVPVGNTLLEEETAHSKSKHSAVLSQVVLLAEALHHLPRHVIGTWDARLDRRPCSKQNHFTHGALNC